MPPLGSSSLSKTSPVLKDEETTDHPPATNVQSKSGMLRILLRKGLGISLPEHYKELLSELGAQPASDPQSKGHLREECPSVYALIVCNKSQVLCHACSGTVDNPLWSTQRAPYMFDISHSADISVYIYLENPRSISERSQDILLGVAQYRHMVQNDSICVQDLTMTPPIVAELDKDHIGSHLRWLDLRHGTGTIQVSVGFSECNAEALQIEDFYVIKSMKRGWGLSYEISQVRKKRTQRIYALKKIQKPGDAVQAEVAARRKPNRFRAPRPEPTEAEVTKAFEIAKRRAALYYIENPFFLPVQWVFQSPTHLYLVSPFVHGGELLRLLNFNEHCFDLESIRHFAAEILVALECLHACNIVYVHLNPKKILLDYAGHILISDFTLGDLSSDARDTNDKIYLAPEVIAGQIYTEVADWWTLGVLLAEMLSTIFSTHPSWYEENPLWFADKITNIHIRTSPISFPTTIPPPACDICCRLLVRDPAQR